MKCSRKSVRTKENAIPQLRFEDQRLTSFAGLVVLQKFFQIIGLKTQLQKCFRHRALGKVFDRSTIFMQLIVHLLLGFRELRDCDHYRDDPMVQRLLGLKRLPDAATLSRMLKEADEKSVTKLRQLLADMVLQRIASLALPRITLDFDGSVQSTVQLDLFEPYAYGFEFKVIVTNKLLGAAGVVSYHEGRGSQEGVFAELKSHCQMDSIPVRTRRGNQLFLLAGLFAFHLVRDLQMQREPPQRTTTRKRSPLWVFERVDTLRKTVFQRAGRLPRPAGTLILTFGAGKNLKQRVSQILESLDTAA